MAYTFFVDFGSTFTKLCVFDLENGELVMTTKRPSTVAADASTGLLATFEEAKKHVGEKGVKHARIMTSSSAAGGLRMVVVGLTKRFSLLAGKNVAWGAGARIVQTFDNFLTDKNIKEIERINPEIILFCGGIEGGNADRVMHNAGKLKGADISSYIVYAGNSEVASHVRQELVSNTLKCFITENVFPGHDKLNAKPAGEIIRKLFMDRIVGAKGLRSVFPIIGNVSMPTPAAVLTGGALLSRGIGQNAGIGDLLLFDVGGATTDVYSYCEEYGTIRRKGSPEPFAKRTVEGDLGIRSSAMSLLELMDVNGCARNVKMSEQDFFDSCKRRAEISSYVAVDDTQREIDFMLTQKAVEVGARRHCGKIVNAYAKNVNEIMEGKDLSGINSIVSTGGAVLHCADPLGVLKSALKSSAEKELLLPQKAEYYMDKEYLMYAIGLGASIDSASVLNIAKEHIVKIS